ncbi:hypothetical protein I8J31_05920 [Marinomonas sp. C1424]|uniref:Uncharacterized protein n=1 Tax=Marinomonas transparens TaxID=2795388 RepID=A0A934JTV1_9GAMM|nr:hypothetical protein [Marinomonas transparens]
MDRIYHPIVESPHLYDIDCFSYKFVEKDNSKSYIDLHLKKDSEVVCLRFWGPQDLEIEKGFPWATGGMFIEDIKSHGLESLGIYVGDFEASNGSITFWAKSVERLS